MGLPGLFSLISKATKRVPAAGTTGRAVQPLVSPRTARPELPERWREEWWGQ